MIVLCDVIIKLCLVMEFAKVVLENNYSVIKDKCLKKFVVNFNVVVSTLL